MNWGMTGNREGLTPASLEALQQLLEVNDVKEVHHGDCDGADADFHRVAQARHLRIVIHPPTDPKAQARCVGDVVRPARPYLQRNHDIVNETELLLAFPQSRVEVVRSGTWATIRYAKKQGKDVILILPDGTIEPSWQ